MSLINQVLKDLEQRHAEHLSEATHSIDGLAFASPAANHAQHRHMWWWPLGILMMILLLAAAAYWQWHQSLSPTAQPAVTSTPASAVSETASSPLAAAPHTVTSPPSSPVGPRKAVPVAEQVRQQAERAPPAIIAPSTPKPAPIVAEDDSAMSKQMVPLRREQKAELAYQSGYAYLQKHQTQRAEQELRSALATEPGHLKARELLAGLLIKQGRWIEVSEILQRGVQLRPQHRPFVTLYARTLMEMERDAQAIALLRDFAPPMADDPDHYALLAALYQRQQDHQAAFNTYTQLLKLRPQAGIWWVGMGISLEALGKHQEAQQAYRQAQGSGTLHGDIARYTDNRLLALDAIRYPID